MSTVKSSFCIWLISLFAVINCKRLHGYFPVTTELRQCCANPVESFILREWSGPCSCQILDQKWLRYKDWVEKSGGYIHPWIQFRYVHQYQDSTPPSQQQTPFEPYNINKKHSKQPTKSKFKMHSHERGVFANIEQKYRTKIQSKVPMMQIPFSITFSQFIISKHIRNATLLTDPLIQNILFPQPDYFMPQGFPDWDGFRNITFSKYRIDSIRGWLALGLAWLKEYTHELLPWLDLLPQPYYLPITWDKFIRNEFQLTGTRALRVITTLERELETTKPYIKMLGLTDEKVRRAFAWVTSRSFGMNLATIGGARKSPAIPCGIDFFNHNIFAESSLYYDSNFGKNRNRLVHGTRTDSLIKNIIIDNDIRDDLTEIDFLSNYLWISDVAVNGSEIFVNYGKHHTSSSRIALFGFIDSVHPNDHLNLVLDLPSYDIHGHLKRKYFNKEWNKTYTQQNSTKYKQQQLDKYQCYEIKPNEYSWTSLGRAPRYRQNHGGNNNKNKQNQQKEEDRYYYPPLTLEYYGQNVLRVRGNFLRFLRLTFLPSKYFDSFTISSRMNDFEFNYLTNIIDPMIKQSFNRICKHELIQNYPTSLIDDKLRLRQIEHERKILLNKLEMNQNQNLSKTEDISQILTSLDRDSLVLQYRIREKTFLDDCSKLDILPTQQYLKSIGKDNVYQFRKKLTNQQQIASSFSDNSYDILQDMILNAFRFLNLDNQNARLANITVTNSQYNMDGNVSSSNEINIINDSVNTTIIEIDYLSLISEVEELLDETDINLDVFEHYDDNDWLQILNEATSSVLTEMAELLDEGELNAVDDVEREITDTQSNVIDDDNGVEIVEVVMTDNTPTIVSKKNLMIGKPKNAKKKLAQTIGWNSPKSALGNSGNKKQTITISGANGQAFDLSSLFGGGSVSISGGNIQINNGQISFGGNSEVRIENNNLNNLLGQFMNTNNNINNNDNSNANAETNRNAISTETKPEIPETVPFSQIMSSATVSVFGMDENGNLVNVGNALNTNNLGSMFRSRKKKRKSLP